MNDQARPSIGGQAVMEGVMMNGRSHYAVAVRKTDGSIEAALFDHGSMTERHKILSWPLIRGVIRFAESLIVGMKTLTYSADFFMEEEEEEKKEPKGKLGRWWQEHGDSITMGITMVLAVLLCLGLFVALPVAISRLLYTYIPSTYVMGIVEGIVRMLLFLLYMVLIAKMKDIQRTFEYHGAEHKVINCFEAGLPLTVENVKTCSRFNKRCGTSFIFIIMLLSILLNALIQVTNPGLRFLCHLALIPVIAGASYEVLKFSARSKSKIIDWLVSPGLMIQRITTNEPDDQEIEVAIASVKTLLEKEHPQLIPECFGEENLYEA